MEGIETISVAKGVVVMGFMHTGVRIWPKVKIVAEVDTIEVKHVVSDDKGCGNRTDASRGVEVTGTLLAVRSHPLPPDYPPHSRHYNSLTSPLIHCPHPLTLTQKQLAFAASALQPSNLLCPHASST